MNGRPGFEFRLLVFRSPFKHRVMKIIFEPAFESRCALSVGIGIHVSAGLLQFLFLDLLLLLSLLFLFRGKSYFRWDVGRPEPMGGRAKASIQQSKCIDYNLSLYNYK